MSDNVDEFGFRLGRSVVPSGKANITCDICGKSVISVKVKDKTKEKYCYQCHLDETNLTPEERFEREMGSIIVGRNLSWEQVQEIAKQRRSEVNEKRN